MDITNRRIKTYTKIVTLATNTNTQIELRDTQGNLVDCDFVSVAGAGNANQWMNITPSTTHYGDMTPTIGESATGAGVAGISVMARREPQGITLPQGVTCQAVVARAQFNDHVIFVYGRTHPDRDWETNSSNSCT